MKKYIVSPKAEIVESSDKSALTEAVKFTRDFTESSEWTSRYPMPVCDEDGEPTGKWDVVCDDRGQNPMGSLTISKHETETEATAEADKLNAQIDAELMGFILQDEIKMPEEVDFIYLSCVQSGKYPQSRKATVSYRAASEFGPVEFETMALWSVNDITNRDMNTGAVAKQIMEDYAEAYATAVEAKREEQEEAFLLI